MTKAKNPLVCDECGHESGAPATARIHAASHNVKGSPENPMSRDEAVALMGEEEVKRVESDFGNRVADSLADAIEATPVEKPKRTRKKAAK